MTQVFKFLKREGSIMYEKIRDKARDVFFYGKKMFFYKEKLKLLLLELQAEIEQ